MREPNNYKFFIEINTFKNQVQVILNRLRKLKDPNVTNAIRLIMDGKLNNSLSAELVTLDSLLNHPERYVKNMNTQTKEAIHSAIKKILEAFIAEFSEEAICLRTIPRA